MKGKKIIAWIGVVILSLTVLLSAYIIFVVLFISKRNYEQEKDLIPIEQITGIYAEASLKPGCYVDSGTSFPHDDNGPWCHCARICAITDLETGEMVCDEHIPVDKLWIVDVYGDHCTIVFSCSDESHGLYSASNYPLANLNYNSRKVEKADDGVMTTLYGSRYTLSKTSGSSFRFCAIVRSLCLGIGSVFGITLLVCKGIRSRQ